MDSMDNTKDVTRFKLTRIPVTIRSADFKKLIFMNSRYNAICTYTLDVNRLDLGWLSRYNPAVILSGVNCGG
jgi:hypothetical protein